jgi:hypothetical protein
VAGDGRDSRITSHTLAVDYIRAFAALTIR